jgi:phenylalanyl-tRNA synthetase beta chain
VDGVQVGHIGRLAASVSPGDATYLAGTIHPEAFMHSDPAQREAQRLPDHPAIERDLSAIVKESVHWAQLVDIAAALNLTHHEATEFVTVYRGKGIEAGHKSLSMRIRFRAADRTLTREEVEPPIESLIAALRSQVDAEIRS